jgi:hypothetical protein
VPGMTLNLPSSSFASQAAGITGVHAALGSMQETEAQRSIQWLAG